MPRLAHKIYDFVGVDDGAYLKVTEAIVRIFDRQDWLRKNRARARIKVLLDKIGPDAFRALVDEELAGRVDRRARLRRRAGAAALRRRRGGAGAGRRRTATARPTATAPSSTSSSSATSAAQRQAGFSAVAVKVTRGDLTPEQFRGLAAIMREFCGGNARTTVEQNLILRWVRDEALYDALAAARATSASPSAGAFEIDDVISCPGTDSCKMGITASMGLNEAIQERLEAMEIVDPLTRQVQIKMSGCPNGCGQHHIGTIGFYGASLKVGGRQMPAYIPHIGGRAADGDVAFGRRLKSRLPAKRVPDAVERWLRMYEAERERGRELRGLRRAGRQRALRSRGQGPDPAGRVQPRDDAGVHRLEPLQPRTKWSAARASARSRAPLRLSWLAPRPAPTSARVREAIVAAQRRGDDARPGATCSAQGHGSDRSARRRSRVIGRACQTPAAVASEQSAPATDRGRRPAAPSQGWPASRIAPRGERDEQRQCRRRPRRTAERAEEVDPLLPARASSSPPGRRRRSRPDHRPRSTTPPALTATSGTEAASGITPGSRGSGRR